MKVAYCFHGNVGAAYSNKKAYESSGDIDYRIGFEHWDRHINKVNDVDVFMHSWSTKYEEGLIDCYQPKKHLIEEQIEFGAVGTNTIGQMRKEFMISRWYSAKQSIMLKKQYEQENNIKYDMVVLSRTDWAWLTDIDFSIFQNTNLFYAPANTTFDKNNPRFDDWIFFSNSENMDNFSNLYNKMYLDRNVIKNSIKSVNSHSDTYTHAQNCGFDIVLVENLRDGVEGMYVRGLYENCAYSDDYKFENLVKLVNGNQSTRF